MQAVNLAQVADELYALPPADFRAARDERANQARSAGDRDLADEIRKLRRPTVSAWLVNQLVRDAPDRVDQLLELGEPLRQAQQALDADRLRDLSAQRRELVAEITQEAKRLAAQARQSFSAQVEREVEATVEAALADPGAAEAVRSGWLTTALAYAGLGGAGVSDAVAVPGARRDRPRQPAPPAPGAGGRQAPARGAREAGAARQSGRAAAAAQRRAREAELAERDLREATAAAQEAEAALDEAEGALAGAGERHQAAQRRIEELEQLLDQSQAHESQLARAVRDAQRSRDVAARWLETAQRRLARAQARAGEHG